MSVKKQIKINIFVYDFYFPKKYTLFAFGIVLCKILIYGNPGGFDIWAVAIIKLAQMIHSNGQSLINYSIMIIIISQIYYVKLE